MSSRGTYNSSGNRFFNTNGEDLGDLPQSGRLYGVLEADTHGYDDDGRSAEPIYMECVDADWLDSLGITSASRPELFFKFVQLRVVEVKDESLLATHFYTGAPAGTQVWFEMHYQVRHDGTQNASLYLGLYTEGTPVRLEKFFAIDSDSRVEALSRLFGSPLEREESREQELLQSIRQQARHCHAVAVYDVGQGSCQAMLHGRFNDPLYPILYFDFGGGALANLSTFPTGLSNMCFSEVDAIVLSHWDWDHWSSAYRFPNSMKLPWIVPPVAEKPVQTTFAFELAKANADQVVVFDSPPGTIVQIGDLTIGRCWGAKSNDSGVAALASVRDKMKQLHRCLLPGDCDYQHLPSNFLVPASWGLVMTHHGGVLRSDSLPIPGTVSVMACSAGPNNTYDHPRQPTIKAHTIAGWPQPVLTGTGGSRPLHLLLSPDMGIASRPGVCLRWPTGCMSAFR